VNAPGRRPDARAPHRPDVWLVLLGLAVVAGLLLRIPGYGDSLNSDELSTYFDVTGRSLGGTLDLVRGDYEITPPLYLLLANLTQGLGDPQDALRIVPFACGLLAIPMTWLLGAWALDRRAATVAGAVMACSPFVVFYSTEARAYSLMMVLVLGSTLALWQAVHGRGRLAWALYALLTCAAMYTHYTAAFVLLAQGAWALAYHRAAWRWLLGANALAALAWLPWLPSYRTDQDTPAARLIGFIDPFDLATFKTDVLHWAVGHPLTIASVRDFPGDAAIALIALGMASAVAAVGFELWRGLGSIARPTEGQALVLALALAAPVIAAIYSTVGVSVFLPRNLLVSSPGLALALAAVVTLPRSQRLWIPAAVLLVTGFAVGGLRMTTESSGRPDFKGAAAYILERGGPQAVVVDVPGNTPGALTHLEVPADPGEPVPRRPRIFRLDRSTQADELRAARPGGSGQFAALPVPPPAQIGRQAARAAAGRDIFLVVYGPATSIASPSVQQALAAIGPAYRPVTSRRFGGFFGYLPVTVTVLRRAA
jgi:mannosyltransferase